MRRETGTLLRWIAAALGCWLAVRFLLPAMLPFLLGLGIALAAEPGVRLLTGKCRLPRGAASGICVAAVFTGACTLAAMALTFFLKELGVLAGILPDLEVTARSGLDSLQGYLLGFARRSPESVRALLCRNVRELFSGGSALLDRGTRYALGLAGTVLSNLPRSALSLGTAVLSAFLISCKLPQMRQWILGMVPRQKLQPAQEVLAQVGHTAKLWFRAQLKLACVTCALLMAGFLLLRVSYGPVWAVLVALVDAIPVLGTGTVLIPWSLVCLLKQDGARALGLLGLYAVVALTRSMLEPRFVGRQLGLDPLVTLIALYTGFRLWGFAGMLLMPLAAMTAVKMVKSE